MRDAVDKPSVLFVCVKNAGKSQMAAGPMSKIAGDAMQVYSAGTKPGTAIKTLSVQALHEVDVDITANTPKPVDPQLIYAVDVVVTLGREAHIEPVPGTQFENQLLEAFTAFVCLRPRSSPLFVRVRLDSSPRPAALLIELRACQLPAGDTSRRCHYRHCDASPPVVATAKTLSGIGLRTFTGNPAYSILSYSSSLGGVRAATSWRPRLWPRAWGVAADAVTAAARHLGDAQAASTSKESMRTQPVTRSGDLPFGWPTIIQWTPERLQPSSPTGRALEFGCGNRGARPVQGCRCDGRGRSDPGGLRRAGRIAVDRNAVGRCVV
jgi:arsenate-mycothiol transferase